MVSRTHPATSTGHAPTPPSIVGTITAAAIAQVLKVMATVRAPTINDGRGGAGCMPQTLDASASSRVAAAERQSAWECQ
jgi:hypothetical protein